MDKRKFFDILHGELEEKYRISPHSIETIRSFSLGDKWTRKQIAEWTVKKLHAFGKNPPTDRYRMLEKMLNFIASCSDSQWKDITQKTQYDK